MADLHVGYGAVVRVTNAYWLGYAVVLLVAGRRHAGRRAGLAVW
ncbi:hypothetical protein [Mycobacterium lepromatosis]|nr:hypothetical protein [Mycobacterium lepromatosis]